MIPHGKPRRAPISRDKGRRPPMGRPLGHCFALPGGAARLAPGAGQLFALSASPGLDAALPHPYLNHAVQNGGHPMSTPVHRKLTTIMAADAAGYSRRMGEDEAATLTALHNARRIIDSLIARHEGRIANTAGDGLIAEFPSVVEAVTCAVEIQRELSARAATDPQSLQFRIGLHLGDVIVDGDDLLGESVNLAARLETMAEPGGILLSRQVYDHVHSKLTVGFEFVGDRRPKNFVEDVEVYRVTPQGGQAPHIADNARSALHLRPAPDRDTDTAPPPGAAPAPLLARLRPMIGDAERSQLLRAAVLIVALVLINLLTWHGTFWAIWPIMALIALRGLRLLSSSRG